VKRKPNPLVVAAKRGWKEGHGILAWLGKWDELRPEMQLDIVRSLFTDEAIYDVGRLILGSLVAGDKQMALTVRDAIKQFNHMFNRDRELALLEPALRYRLCNWDVLLHKNRGDMHRSVEELKAGIEQHCNRGKQLEPHQWQRLRRALRLPKRSCVRSDRKAVKPVVEIIDFAPAPDKKRRRKNIKHETG
jgi:hypothetical protein